MKISVVVPTLDCKEEVARLLFSITKLKLDKKIELIAVDSGSKDGTLDLLDNSFATVIDFDEKLSKGAARNLGIKSARCNVIANIDSDVEILDGWYEALIHAIGCNDIVAGYSPDPYGKNLPRVPIYVDGQDITWPACNIAHKRSVFDEVGYYNEIQNLPEDCELNYRCVNAGYTILYEPRMKLYHYQRSAKVSFAKQAFWNGEARYELNKLHPELKHSHQHGANLKNLFRLGFGFMGYVMGRYFYKKGEKI